MSETNTKRIGSLHFRAYLPRYFRIGAIVLLALTLAAVGIGYYRARSNAEFRMIGFPAELSKDVIASVTAYERRESDADGLKYYIKADTATTYSDNHQELENVYLQVFGDGNLSDEITANKAVYVPGEGKTFTGYFAGNVNILSRDKLRLRTEQVTYSQATETATAEEDVNFERFNLKGRSTGASVNMAQRLLELMRNAEVEIAGENGSHSKITAGNALYDQRNERLEMPNGALLERHSPFASRTIDSKLKADRLVAHLTEPTAGVRMIDRVELFENVNIERNDAGRSIKLQGRSGNYSRHSERYELNQDVKGTITRADSVYDLQAGNASYDGGSDRIELSGNARIQNESGFASGQSLVAFLDAAYSVKQIDAAGRAQIRQTAPEYTTDIASPNFTAIFGEDGVLARADSQGPSEIVRTSAADATRLTINASTAIHSEFRSAGAIKSIEADGRTVVRLDVPDNGLDSANRSLTADKVKTVFQPDGKTLQRAEADGDAEFATSPHHAGPKIYALRTKAPRLECDFYSGNGDPQICVASEGTRSTRTPTVKQDGHGEQTITSNRLTVSFDQRSRSISRLDAGGKAKFAELDRTAIAESFVFTTSDEMVQLRGGDPTAWDSTARLRAKEIDWDTRNSRSVYRGSVSSTYYNSKSVGNASPFGDEAKPFYITSESAELDHRTETGVFIGNARGWQGNNYVRGDRMELRKRDSQLVASGSVQSMLYNVRKTRQSPDGSTPVFAAASEMLYDGKAHTIKYDKGVDIRQGTDRIGGVSAFIQLDDRNEMVQTNIDSNVTISQTGRKASADAAIYTVSDDKLFLRGRPARVEDLERGASQGEELVIYLSDNRMTGEGKSKTNPSGRVRNIYKVN